MEYRDQYSSTLFPSKWSSKEKKELQDFWLNRYATHNVHMSPLQEISSGGDTLISPKLIKEDMLYKAEFENDYNTIEGLKKSYKDPAHPVTKRYNEEMQILKNERNVSYGPDVQRIDLLIKASESAYQNFNDEENLAERRRNLEGRGIRVENDKMYSILTERYEQSTLSLGTDLSALVNYDKLYNHPLSYQDRDLKEEPVNIKEKVEWCNRESFEDENKARLPTVLRRENEFVDKIIENNYEEYSKLKLKNGEERYNNKINANPKYLEDRVNNIIKELEEKNLYRTSDGKITSDINDERRNSPSIKIFENFNDRNKELNLNYSTKEQFEDYHSQNLEKYVDPKYNKQKNENKDYLLSQEKIENRQKERIESKKELDESFRQKNLNSIKMEEEIKYRKNILNDPDSRHFIEEQRKERDKIKEKEEKSKKWEALLSKTKTWTDETVNKIKSYGEKIKNKYHELTKDNKIDNKPKEELKVIKERAISKDYANGSNIRSDIDKKKKPSLKRDVENRENRENRENKKIITKPTLKVKEDDNIKKSVSKPTINKPLEKPVNNEININHNIKI